VEHRNRGEASTTTVLLITGPWPRQKTTMGLVIAKELGVRCRITVRGPERPRIVGADQTCSTTSAVIDEIPRLNRVAEESALIRHGDYRLISRWPRQAPPHPRWPVGAVHPVGAPPGPAPVELTGVTASADQRLEFYGSAIYQGDVERDRGWLQSGGGREAAPRLPRCAAARVSPIAVGGCADVAQRPRPTRIRAGHLVPSAQPAIGSTTGH